MYFRWVKSVWDTSCIASHSAAHTTVGGTHRVTRAITVVLDLQRLAHSTTVLRELSPRGGAALVGVAEVKQNHRNPSMPTTGDVVKQVVDDCT